MIKCQLLCFVYKQIINIIRMTTGTSYHY